jgi:hypothetical protein
MRMQILTGALLVAVAVSTEHVKRGQGPAQPPELSAGRR